MDRVLQARKSNKSNTADEVSWNCIKEMYIKIMKYFYIKLNYKIIHFDI